LKHGRPVTDVVYNRDGDLLFSCDKDGNTFVWRSDNGERLGTYGGPNKRACNSLDVDRDCKNLLSGWADGFIRLWDVESGKKLYEWNNDIVVRCVKFAHNDRKFLSIMDNVFGQKSMIQVSDLPNEYGQFEDSHKKGLLAQIQEESSSVKVYKGIWTLDNQNIITCNSEGRVNVYNTETQKKIKTITAHEGPIINIKHDKYCVHFVTASKDGKAKLFDMRDYREIKTFEVGRPINCADISPIMEHVVMGGGERAEEVTTSGATTEQFQVRFYHSIFEEELGSVLGHFGPVNSISFNPDGTSFASGGEDGYVRIRLFPKSYLSDNVDDERVYFDDE